MVSSAMEGLLVLYSIPVRNPKSGKDEPCAPRASFKRPSVRPLVGSSKPGVEFSYSVSDNSNIRAALHPVDTDRQAIFEREVLRVLCQHRGVIPAETQGSRRRTHEHRPCNRRNDLS